MAVDAPLLVRKSVVAAKPEVTTGTAIALATGDTAMYVSKPKFSQKAPAIMREGQVSFSPLAPVPGASMGEAAFTTDLCGNGASGLPLWATALLASCGFTVTSTTYSPVSGSASYQTSTMGHYIDGRFKSIAGACGDATIKLKAGEIGKIDWKFMGLWVAPTPVALPAWTCPTVTPPRFTSATLTIASTTYKISEVEIAFGNKVVMREDATKASGYFAACITDREITVKVDPEALALGTKDWYADYMASTQVALNCVIGASANNIITIAAPKLTLKAPPEDGDRDGVLTDKLEFVAARSACAGDDEMTIGLT